MITTRYHMSFHVRNFLKNTKFPKGFRKMFLNADGRSLSAEEARDFLLDEVAKGHVVIPCGNACGNPCKQPGCSGYDYSGGGCPGYPIDDTEQQPATTEA